MDYSHIPEVFPVLNLTDSSFENEVLFAKQDIVVVDFWAPWCGPCKTIGHIIGSIASDFRGKIKVVSCNVDKFESIARRYKVDSVPTLIFFKHGKMIQALSGKAPKAKIKSIILTLL